jgi:hypothetical protein
MNEIYREKKLELVKLMNCLEKEVIMFLQDINKEKTYISVYTTA